ncbi:MAG: hemerythrin domain-containing protein [Verrucomicrobia bacterium]|nr:hemerythrin domain-containing protein [Verrucomicrobiota bacterium]
MKATDVLVSQHKFLASMFGYMERALPEAATSAEVAALARLAEDLIRDHAEAEEMLLFSPLDALLTEKGQFAHFYSSHKEYMRLLEKPQAPMAVTEARSLLLLAFRILRTHFHDEERLVIPLAHAAFPPESLEKLGNDWMQRHAPLESSEP